MLRVLGALIVASAMLLFLRGGVLFDSEPDHVPSDTYVIHHTLILPHSVIAVAAVGGVVFGSSFLIGSKPRRNTAI
jgi:hypothetical protein